jgi:hypothetical protein
MSTRIPESTVKVVGIDGSSAFSPKLIVLVTDTTGTHVEALDCVKNKRQ